jgi:histidine ammonia-lyase
VIQLSPGSVTLAQLRAVWAGAPVTLSASAWSALDAAAESIARIVASGRTVYGVNTGFGLLAQERIANDRLLELQRNLILSHSCGLGEALKPEVVRLAMVLKVIGLARGHSGVRRLVVERLLALLETGALPVIPAQGSVGASGDLAPLAHMSAALIGEGQIAIHGRSASCGRGAGSPRSGAAGARTQRGFGADQRHPGVHCHRARRALRRRARLCRRPDQRRAVGRCAER